MRLDHTHEPSARSWLGSAAPGCDFPLQNLPFGVFRRRDSEELFRGGVAIGDQVLDLAGLATCGLLDGLAADAAAAASCGSLNALMALDRDSWRTLRHSMFALLRDGSPHEARLRPLLSPLTSIEHALPARVGDYTDFYTSLHHARNIGRLFSDAAEVVHPNFHHVPIAYHGRCSSLVISETPLHRPVGPSCRPGRAPQVGPCAQLDYEVELAAFIGPGTVMGETISLEQAENHLFGVALLNDWSARDIQAWEMTPLGPFLGKNFGTSLSPWIVTLEALAPFRSPWRRDNGLPRPAAYLEPAISNAPAAFDIRMEASIQTLARQDSRQSVVQLSLTSFRHQHWTFAQMLAHHTVGGCPVNPGDVLASGTISGPGRGEAGCLMELTQGGRSPACLSGSPGGEPGERRAFLEDGDTVILRARCEAPGFVPIGFGECRGTILPARALAA